MKKLFIEEARKDIIEEFLEEKQNRAKERRIDSYKELVQKIEEAEKALGTQNLPKNAKAGCVLYVYEGAGKFPNAYKYIPQGTCVRIQYNKQGVAELTDVTRENVNGQKPFEWKVTESLVKKILMAKNVIEVKKEEQK